MKKLKIKNRQGQEIVVIVDKVENQKGLAFVAHGFGGFKDQPHIETMAKAFVDNGYTAIRFDAVNTFGENGGNVENANITNYLEDLEDVINWTKDKDWYQEPFCLAGHSLGSLTIAIYSELNSGKVMALAPTSTVVSGESYLNNLGKEELAERNETGWQIKESSSIPGLMKKLRWPQFEREILKYDILVDSDKLNMPVLLVVGSEDDSTPPEGQKILYEKLNTDKEFHIIEGSEHTFRDEEHLKQLYNIFDKWIKNKL